MRIIQAYKFPNTKQREFILPNTWSVKVGDAVKEDDILFEVTTAKVNAEIPSPVEGTVLEILFKEGDTVSVGTVVVIMCYSPILWKIHSGVLI